MLFPHIPRALIAMVALMACTLSAHAERINFDSANRNTTYAKLLQHKVEYSDQLVGDLQLPPKGKAPFPAMVIVHGSGGVSQHQYNWASFFNQLGIATLVIDSYGPRNIKDTINDQSQLTSATSVIDGFQALKLLAANPSIDARRIGITGYSRGAEVAIITSFEKLRSAAVPGDLKFALHVPFYGGCTQYGTTTGAPILVLMGSKDESAPVASCAVNEKNMQEKGANYKVVMYEGAMHGFDSDNSRVVYLARSEAHGKCAFNTDYDRLKMRIDGSKQDATPEEVKSYMKSCTTRGWSFGGNPSVYAKSREETKAFVTQNFGLTQ